MDKRHRVHNYLLTAVLKRQFEVKKQIPLPSFLLLSICEGFIVRNACTIIFSTCVKKL